MSPRESSKIIKKGGGKVLTTFSTASPCAPAVRAFGVPFFYATSWCFPRSSQEVRFRQAEISCLLVRGREHRAGCGRKHCAPGRSPLDSPFCAALQIISRDKHISRMCRASRQPPRAADMGSKMCCFLSRGGACSSRLIGVFLHGGRIWNAPLHSWSGWGGGTESICKAN